MKKFANAAWIKWFTGFTVKQSFKWCQYLSQLNKSNAKVLQTFVGQHYFHCFVTIITSMIHWRELRYDAFPKINSLTGSAVCATAYHSLCCGRPKQLVGISSSWVGGRSLLLPMCSSLSSLIHSMLSLSTATDVVVATSGWWSFQHVEAKKEKGQAPAKRTSW